MYPALSTALFSDEIPVGLYRVLADVGGTELVGPARELDKGTFYDPEKSD